MNAIPDRSKCAGRHRLNSAEHALQRLLLLTIALFGRNGTLMILWRYKVRFQTVKLCGTLGVCARIIMARTFGQYIHSGWNGQCDYARYHWRGHDYFIQMTPAKPTEPKPLAQPKRRRAPVRTL